MPAPVLLRLPVARIRQLVAALPRTHEMGGHLQVGDDGVLHDVVTFEGAQCRDLGGARLSGAAQCRIHKPDAAISFHTHPRSNRPSSADLRNAVLKHPHMSRKGRRRLSLVFTPRGLWWYVPSPTMRDTWKTQLQHNNKAFVKTRMRKWSRAGRRFIVTPRGGGAGREDPAGLCRYMAGQGMALHYLSHDELPPAGEVVVRADGSRAQ